MDVDTKKSKKSKNKKYGLMSFTIKWMVKASGNTKILR